MAGARGKQNSVPDQQTESKKQTKRYVCTGGNQGCGAEIGEKEEPIKCDICEDCFHAKCQKIPSQALQVIRKFNLFWLCEMCKVNVKEMKKVEERLEEKIAETERNILKAIQTQSEAEKLENRIEEKIKVMEMEVMQKISEQCANVETVLGQQKEVVKETKKTYSEIAQGNLGSQKSETAIVEKVGGKLSEVMNEREEIEKRRLNVIVHGLPETNGGKDGSVQGDREAFEALCLEQLKVDGIRYESAVRLGRKPSQEGENEDGAGRATRPWIRPLKIQLSDAISKMKIMRALPELRKENSKTYITHDKTPKQREAERNLKEKCKKYNEEHPKGEVEAFIQRGEMAFRERKVQN